MIRIRKAKLGDEKGIAEMVKESIKDRSWSHIGDNKPLSRERIKRIRNELSLKRPDTFRFVAIDTQNKKLVGVASFTVRRGRLSHRVKVFWAVHVNYFGRGIGTKIVRKMLSEAKNMGFVRADTEITVNNTSSIKLAKRLGFKIEGRKKKGVRMDNGKYVDTYVIGKVLR